MTPIPSVPRISYFCTPQYHLMEYFTHLLPNGIRLVHIPDTNHVSHCGILVNSGTRDENDEEHGIAHFIEHVIFKGTQRRKAYHILSRLDDVGGEINAYTTKEETAFYASFLNQYYERAFELISDIVFHSIFPQHELAREKEVIIDEINSYKDSPADLIFDEFEEMIYRNHPIGRNVLGTATTIESFTRQSVTRFMNRTYNTDEMVICSVGNISFGRLTRLVEKYFGEIPENPRRFGRSAFQSYQQVIETKNLQTYQAHCIMGNLAFHALEPRRMNLILLNNILGGQGLNSRLNMSLREKHGYAYNIESTYTPYTDTGVLTIYFGTDKEKLGKCIHLVNKELDKLRNQRLGSVQLRRAKNQILGQIAMSTANKENLLFTLGKSILLFDRFESLISISQKIEAITADDLMDTANLVLDPGSLSQLVYL